MAVDIKTLRIGSHVEYDGKRMAVASVSNKLMNCENLVLIEPSTLTLYKNVNGYDVMPIKITPEILAEIGFKYHEYDNGKLWEWRFSDLNKAYGYLEFDEDTTTIWRGRLWHMKEVEMEFMVEYLHDLENIFYMFYEVELIKE